MSLAIVIRTIRVPFLVLTPVCILLGASTAAYGSHAIDYKLLALVLTGGFAAHIAVNTLNEYFDFKSGLDLNTVRTPFSGGSGALPQEPSMLNYVLLTAIVSLLVTLAVGIYFVIVRGAAIIPLGVAGLLLIATYSGWVNRHPLVCLLAPGAGFGLLMVVGTHYVLTDNFSLLCWLAAMVPFFLANNLLLLNQYPDIQADAAVGRYHLPIAFGVPFSNRVYALLAMAAAIVIAGSVLGGYFPASSLFALLPLSLAAFSLTGAVRFGASIGDYPKYLAANVLVVLLTTSLLAVSLITG